MNKTSFFRTLSALTAFFMVLLQVKVSTDFSQQGCDTTFLPAAPSLSGLSSSSLSTSRLVDDRKRVNILIVIHPYQRYPQWLDTAAVVTTSWARTASNYYDFSSADSSAPRHRFHVKYIVDSNSSQNGGDFMYSKQPQMNTSSVEETLLRESALMHGIHPVHFVKLSTVDDTLTSSTASFVSATADHVLADATVYDWIYIVSEEVHVNIFNLAHFLDSTNALSTKYTMYGVHKNKSTSFLTEKSLLTCTAELSAGGIVLSRPTLLDMAQRIEQCKDVLVATNDVHDKPNMLSSELGVFINLCAQSLFGVDCQRLPVQNLDDQAAPHGSQMLSSLGATFDKSLVAKYGRAVAIGHVQNNAQFRVFHQYYKRELAAFTVSLRAISANTSIVPWNDPFSTQEHVFEEVKFFANEYGIIIDESTNIVTQLHTKLCQRSKKKHLCYNDTRSFQLRKCLTCQNTHGAGDWHSAVSLYGAMLARIDPRGVAVLSDYSMNQRFRQFDVLVPVHNNTARTIRFVRLLNKSVEAIKWYNITFRVILSSYQDDTWLESGLYRQVLHKRLGANTSLNVILAPCPLKVFHRAQARNCCLRQACQGSDCVVASMDVDMDVRTSFLLNAMAFVQSSTTAYFPIVYSAFNPETIELVRQASNTDLNLSKLSRWMHVDHRGHWRPYGYGMWAMSGSDAAGVRYNESFQGWGGEDVAFYSLIASRMNIVRMKDPGLIHVWHSKQCDEGSKVNENYILECRTSLLRSDGSLLGYYLKSQKEHDKMLI